MAVRIGPYPRRGRQYPGAGISPPVIKRSGQGTCPGGADHAILVTGKTGVIWLSGDNRDESVRDEGDRPGSHMTTHRFPFDQMDRAFEVSDKKLDDVVKPLVTVS